MKQKYQGCIISLIIFIVGLVCIPLFYLLMRSQTDLQNILTLLALCATLIGFISFVICYKKYLIIQSLECGKDVITRWTFDASQSPIISKALISQKNNNIATAILGTFLGLIFSITLAFSSIDSAYYISIGITILSFIGLFIALMLIHDHYEYKCTHPCHIIFSKDFIFYLGEIYHLNKSFYFLENIIIKTDDEPSISFLYGQTDTDDDPIFALDIPIPKDQLHIAAHLKKYYLSLMVEEEDSF